MYSERRLVWVTVCLLAGRCEVLVPFEVGVVGAWDTDFILLVAVLSLWDVIEWGYLGGCIGDEFLE